MFAMGFQIRGPLLCLVTMTLLLSGGLARQDQNTFNFLKQMLRRTDKRIGVVADKQKQDMETLNRGLNDRVEERVKYLFRKWAGMPEIPIYCPSPVLSDKVMAVSCKGPYTEGQACHLKCQMSILLRGSRFIKCTRSANDYTGYWAIDGEEPKCDLPKCPPLPAPNNGALVCDKWSGGGLCQMQCQEGYDVPPSPLMPTIFLCSLSRGVWNQQHVPDCTYREIGEKRRMSEYYYFTGKCNPGSTEVKKSFLSVVAESDLCPDSRYCKVDNVEVKCGEEDEDDFVFF